MVGWITILLRSVLARPKAKRPIDEGKARNFVTLVALFQVDNFFSFCFKCSWLKVNVIVCPHFVFSIIGHTNKRQNSSRWFRFISIFCRICVPEFYDTPEPSYNRSSDFNRRFHCFYAIASTPSHRPIQIELPCSWRAPPAWTIKQSLS